jgi:hypothetical protein
MLCFNQKNYMVIIQIAAYNIAIGTISCKLLFIEVDSLRLYFMLAARGFDLPGTAAVLIWQFRDVTKVGFGLPQIFRATRP